MLPTGEMWSNLGSAMTLMMFVYTIYQQYFPPQLRIYFRKYTNKLTSFFVPYIQIIFHEYTTGRFNRSEMYTIIQTYLAANSSKRAKRLKADMEKDSENIVLSMDDYEEVTDEFQGVKIWWSSSKSVTKSNTISLYPAADERKYYKLTVHKRHRDLITESYLNHVIKEGKAIAVRNRKRKLYTNNPSQNWYGWKGTKWSHVAFEHPATFQTLALEPKMKEGIMKDLDKFSQGKDYYNKVGKAWKRGYLLYGPPGTGKSTMIAAMANHLNYDVYDLELTAVKDNTELRKLLIETSGKSIIVIEDIDCSLDLAGRRKEKKKEKSEDKEEEETIKKIKNEDESRDSKVTLSGLLNFIDGIWSACGGERIIVFTTNYVEKLDPALIRRGRMDKRIELSYCCFEAFRVLAKNYLDIEYHELFETIKKLFEETNMTPADVAENLMPKSDTEDAEHCLKVLVEALETEKEEARKKAEEEAQLKAENEEKEKEKEKESSAKEDVKDTEKKSPSEVKENGKVSLENGHEEE